MRHKITCQIHVCKTPQDRVTTQGWNVLCLFLSFADKHTVLGRTTLSLSVSQPGLSLSFADKHTVLGRTTLSLSLCQPAWAEPIHRCTGPLCSPFFAFASQVITIYVYDTYHSIQVLATNKTLVLAVLIDVTVCIYVGHTTQVSKAKTSLSLDFLFLWELKKNSYPRQALQQSLLFRNLYFFKYLYSFKV